jgi:5-hydroxyisourate hydrolase
VLSGWAGVKPAPECGKMRQMEAEMADGWLTTHILDTARGLPAAGVTITLYRLEGAARIQLAQTVTNADGRTDAPMLKGEDFRIGRYELVFAAGDYLRATGQVTGETLFLDDIPLRFGISDAGSHYHVPLLLSGFGYSTYRGS